ncbi:DUF1237 domain protein [Drechmeria coniospora]|uniref:DUF1237 domain protein n=1 Tax=Drechmeria coniospora TaxID=98403 RepID=A0A151GN27_DRECN|nr:DUF1237 domain protein [Drechmeria coniospora]KYK58515.1 DUF1237 domain protein [Drechmeria coniospora]
MLSPSISPLLAALPLAHALQIPLRAHERTPSTCPDYTKYSQKPHEPLSSGPLALPFMRPAPECRTFTSPAVERVIGDMKQRIRDPDLARLFENTFPSTLDTTVKYFDPTANLAFIVTGWIRDTGNQFAHLVNLLPQDENLQALVKAVINTEARYLSQFPYCGAFQPPPESGLAPSFNDWAAGVTVNPPVDDKLVFECKYELDSLASFLKLSRSYYDSTEDASFINDNWLAAVKQTLRVIVEQSQSSEVEGESVSYYNWTGSLGSLAPRIPNKGNGKPVKANGLVASHHRPSDDPCFYKFITSVNAMMAVELDHIARILEQEAKHLDHLSREARRYSTLIRDAIWDHTMVEGDIFAYETDGFGNQYIIDDANVPSLLSLPYLGFLDRNDPTYKRTKAKMWSNENPFYAEGKQFSGVGGPHVSPDSPWPMSHISAIFGTDDDDEIKERLAMILENTSGLGLIHESLSVHSSSAYTRPWFAWANSYFAEMILDLAERKPQLIFDDDTPYSINQDGTRIDDVIEM